jgi:hypothetical protein
MKVSMISHQNFANTGDLSSAASGLPNKERSAHFGHNSLDACPQTRFVGRQMIGAGQAANRLEEGKAGDLKGFTER